MEALLAIFLSILIGSSYQDDGRGWSYDYETQWPGICRTGQKQSPINIMTRDAVLDKHGSHLRGPLRLRGYRSVTMTALNNGHTLKWNVADYRASAPHLSGGPLRGNYSLIQFHLHWLSEHAIDGMKYPLEIHFVHIKTGLEPAEALKRSDGLAVIGVLAQVRSNGYESERALHQIMPVLPKLLNSTSHSDEETTIDMSVLFSPEPQSYYTYHGSLTTPTCDEAVTWIVMDKPISISDTQYKIFSKVNVGGIDNYRSLQPANRVVYRSIASCSSALTPGLLGFLVTLFSCFTSNLSSLVGKGLCGIYNLKKRFSGSVIRECGVAVTLLVETTSTSSTPSPNLWNYDDESSWPGQKCHSGGRRQSPINIRTPKVMMDYGGAFIKYGPLKFLGFNSVLLTGFNNGRTIQFSTEGHRSMHPYMSGGPLRTEYRLEQFHFHRLSEHAIDGHKFAIEIHFVHILANQTVTQALKERNGIAIVSVFCNVTDDITGNQLLMMDEVLEQIPNLPERGSRLSGLLFDLTKLLSIDKSSYYAYEGSLTSPECDEVVTWILFTKPLYISQAQLQVLSTLNGGSYNFRKLQPMKRHLIYGSIPVLRRGRASVVEEDDRSAFVKWFESVYRTIAELFSSLTR